MCVCVCVCVCVNDPDEGKAYIYIFGEKMINRVLTPFESLQVFVVSRAQKGNNFNIHLRSVGIQLPQDGALALKKSISS